MTEDSHFCHGLVPGDLQLEIIQVLFINSNNLKVPYALPTQLSDILLTSEPSTYTRALFGLFCSRFILKDLDHFMTSLYTSRLQPPLE